MAAHQAAPSLGFSRQEYWSGLPFPSPMHESEKWKWSRSVMSDSLRPHGLQPTRILHPWDFPGKSTGVGCHCLLCNFSLVARFIYHLPFYSFFSEYSSSMSRGFLKIHTQNFKPCILTHSDQVKKAHCFHGSGHHLSTDVALHNHYLLHATSYCYFIWA